MGSEFKVKVLSPNRPVANVVATSVMLPGTCGYMEILPDHAAMIAALDIGELRIKKREGDTLTYFMSGGYVDVQANAVTVLVDTIESPSEIDRQRAAEAAKRADERLVGRDPRIDLGRALMSMKRASERLAYLEKIQKRI